MNNSGDYQGFREEFEQIGHSLLRSPAAQTSEATVQRHVWSGLEKAQTLERVSGHPEPGAKWVFMPGGDAVDSLALAECRNAPAPRLQKIKEALKRNESHRQVIHLAHQRCPAVVCKYSHS